MKIVCDSCSTKYSISDDKVRGKVFKIRCKKCSHIIVVKGNTEAAAPAAPEAPTDAVWHLVVDGDQVGPLTDADVRARLSRNEITPENYVWKEGFGDWLRLADVPEFADVAASAASAPLAGELFSDSDRADATQVGDSHADAGLGGFFGAGVAGAEGAGARAGEASDEGGFSLSSSAAGGSTARQRGSSSSAMSEEMPAEDDAFGARGGGFSGGGAEAGDLFGAVAPVAARVDSGRVRGGRGSNGAGASGRHDGGRVENLTAQRSENSVLFSLSNLQSLAAPAPSSPKVGSIQATEGSGLIDIRAMAASTLKAPASGGMPSFGGDSRRGEDELPAFGAFSSAAPVLLSIPTSSGPPKWLYAVLGVAAVMIALLLVATVRILSKPVTIEQPAAVATVAPPANVPAAPAKAAPGTAPGADPGASSAKPMAAGDLPPREGGDPAAAGAAGGDKAVTRTGKGGKGKGARAPRAGGASGDGKNAGGAVVAAASSAPAEPEKAKPAKGSLDDLLEGALNGRRSGGGKQPKVDEEPPAGNKKSAGAGEASGGNGPLAKAAVVAGMNGVKGKVSNCYAQFKVPGMAMVNVVIAKSGKVSGATVTGKFAGTPTGACVENAVKSASFPPSDGLTTPYPFSLR